MILVLVRGDIVSEKVKTCSKMENIMNDDETGGYYVIPPLSPDIEETVHSRLACKMRNSAIKYRLR